MKKLNRKLLAFLLVLVCVFSLTGCSMAITSPEESPVDAITEAQFENQLGGVVETLAGLSDADIQSYKDSSDVFTKEAINAFCEVKDELGAFKGMEKGVTVAYKHEVYTVSGVADFENYTCNVNLYMGEDPVQGIVMKTLAMEINYDFKTLMVRAALNTAMGVGVVFVVLIFLSLIISLFKFVSALENKMTKKEAPKKAAPAPAPAAPAPVVEDETDDLELVAVIAAAIAAAENTSTDSFVVRSIRKVNKNKWRNA